MGMYDEISNSLAKRIVKECPNCHKNLYDCDEPAEWQTKSFSKILQTISLEDLSQSDFEMHTICPHCGDYMSANVSMEDGDYNIRTNAYDIDYRNFEDNNLVTDFKKVQINNISNKYVKNWLDIHSITFDELAKFLCIDKEFVGTLDAIKDLADDYYIIPKSFIDR